MTSSPRLSERAVEAASRELFDTDASFGDARRAVEAAAPFLRQQWVAEVVAAIRGLDVKSDYDGEAWLDFREVLDAIVRSGQGAKP